MSKESPPESAGGKPPVALIAGPTASGKSDLAVRLALALEDAGQGAVVINADSAQVYSDLAVLSARPTTSEMGGIDHRLFGAWDGATPCSAADWASAAKREIAAAHDANRIPVLVGGTGLYMRTLLDGIAPIPAIDPAVRESVRALSTAEARAALTREDPARAALLSPNDTQRTQRALEVMRSTGRSIGDWQEALTGGIAASIDLHPLILLPDRDWLFERCNRRFELMLDGGAVEEVERLRARQLDPDLPVMRAIGVPEISSWLDGSTDRAAMIAAGQQATRNYAKRQFTWFRRQPPEDWTRMTTQNVDLTAHFELLFRN